MATRTDYDVGDTITYGTIMGRLRTVRVTDRFEHVSETLDALGQPSRPGFDGVDLLSGETVWGYDDQIVESGAAV